MTLPLKCTISPHSSHSFFIFFVSNARLFRFSNLHCNLREILHNNQGDTFHMILKLNQTSLEVEAETHQNMERFGFFFFYGTFWQNQGELTALWYLALGGKIRKMLPSISLTYIVHVAQDFIIFQGCYLTILQIFSEGKNNQQLA